MTHMRRARGEFHSASSSSRKDRKQGPGSHPKTEREPYGEHGSYNPYKHGKYVKRTGHRFDALPRPSKTGIVGSFNEVDWSVRTAYLPVGFMLNLREWGGPLFRAICGAGSLRNKPGWVEQTNKPPAHLRPPKGFTYFDSLSWNEDKHVRAWTRFANHFGIEYSGDRYYKFPKSMLGELHSKSGIYYRSKVDPFVAKTKKEEFALLKLTGVISRKRSQASKIRRAARRSRDSIVKPILKDEILQYRQISRRSAAKEGIKPSSRPRELVLVGKRRTFAVRSKIVQKAIDRIFSKEEPFFRPSLRTEPAVSKGQFSYTIRQTVYKQSRIDVKIGTAFKARPFAHTLVHSTIGNLPYYDRPEVQDYFTEPDGDGRMLSTREFSIENGQPSFAHGWW